MILLLNGAFGIGKTTVARALVTRMPRAVLYDPEKIGMILQRFSRAADFQDLRLWRRLTVVGIRMMRMVFPNVIVPMAISNPAYLDEIRNGLGRDVVHVCLVAPFDVVRQRLLQRERDHGAWELRRAEECCAAHASDAFAIHVRAEGSVDDVASRVLDLHQLRDHSHQ